MSFGGPFGARLRTSGLAIPTPIYASEANDFPIDLRKKAAIRRERQHQSGYGHRGCSDDDDDDDDEVDKGSNKEAIPKRYGAELWSTNGDHSDRSPHTLLSNPYLLSLRNLHPLLTHQYGIQYALFTSQEGGSPRAVPVPFNNSPENFMNYESVNAARVGKYSVLTNRERHPNVVKVAHDKPPESLQRFHDESFKSSKITNSSSPYYSPLYSYPQNGRTSSSPSPTIGYEEKHYVTAKRGTEVRAPNCSSDYRPHKFTQKIQNCNVSDKHRNSPVQEKQLRFKIKRFIRRSFSCSDINSKSIPDKIKKFSVHPGYESDNECRATKPEKTSIRPSWTPAATSVTRTERPFYKEPYKKRKFHHTDGYTKPVQSNEKDRTLLHLLVSKPIVSSPLRNGDVEEAPKKSIDVLLQHLRQSPVHKNSNADGSPWSVYEYYNKLVERFHDYPYQHMARKYYQHSPQDRSSPSSGTYQEDDDPGNQQKKRPTRALTGKHVKHGTGASLSTLITLRQKIQERQKAKELHNGQHHETRIMRNANNTRKPKTNNLKRLRTAHMSPTITANLRS